MSCPNCKVFDIWVVLQTVTYIGYAYRACKSDMHIRCSDMLIRHAQQRCIPDMHLWAGIHTGYAYPVFISDIHILYPYPTHTPDCDIKIFGPGNRMLCRGMNTSCLDFKIYWVVTSQYHNFETFVVGCFLFRQVSSDVNILPWIESLKICEFLGKSIWPSQAAGLGIVASQGVCLMAQRPWCRKSDWDSLSGCRAVQGAQILGIQINSSSSREYMGDATRIIFLTK